MGREKTQFKKGQSGNPSGRPKIGADLTKLNHLTKQKLITILNTFINMTRDEIAERLQDPKATMLEMAVGHIIAKAAKEGDTMRLNFLFDRIVGKVTDVVEQTNVNLDYNPDEYKEVPVEALIKLVSNE